MSPGTNHLTKILQPKLSYKLTSPNCEFTKSQHLSWNKYMKSYNGNNRDTLNIAHWNAGSSYLGRSLRGVEKVLQIEVLLKKYNVDILGISEANWDCSFNSYIMAIEGNKVIKFVSGSN